MVLHVGNRGAERVRIFGPSLPVRIVVHHLVPLFHALDIVTSLLLSPCGISRVHSARVVTRLAFASFFVVRG